MVAIKNSTLACIIVFISFSFLSNCQHDNEKRDVFFDLHKWRNEILDSDSIKINGKIKYLMDLDDAHDLFGMADTVIPIRGFPSNYIYVDNDKKGITGYMIANGNIINLYDNFATINTVDFDTSPHVTLEHPKITLKKGTTFLELSKIFPQSCKLIESGGNEWSGFVILKTSYRHIDTNRWVLMFRGERLYRIMLVNLLVY